MRRSSETISSRVHVIAFLALFAALSSLAAGASRPGHLYVNLIWHQHQPLYVDPETDQLRGPWVRTHATKDYYDMAAMLKEYPEVHATINLTSSLLLQLTEYYYDRLTPSLYKHGDGNWAVDTAKYFEQWQGKTDPWIDLALRPTESFNEDDIAKLVYEPWNAFGISSIQIAHFPEYAALRDKSRSELTTDDYTAIKAWFYLAHFDPDFLRGTSDLDVNLSDLIVEREPDRFYLVHPLMERDANRLVADAVRVMQEVIPIHASQDFDNDKRRADGTAYWQLEIITTPFYHPILPLLIDSDVARICQPKDSLPHRFAYPADAAAQVVKGCYFFNRMFGYPNLGMWPAEGSISQATADIFAKSGIEWICGDMRVLERSKPSNLDVAKPCRLSTPHGDIMIVFRETNLSDHIGFTYQHMQPDSAVRHFISEVKKYRPKTDEPDRLLTVILDGENAWEWYEYDMDGKKFLHGLYQALSEAYRQGEFTCVTPLEYIDGAPERGVPPHPIETMQKIEQLWPGSWINANFDTWIGEPEENRAWEYLLQTRRDLEMSGLKQPDPFDVGGPHHSISDNDAKLWMLAQNAYESMYAAEGSDWFWWYGADQSALGGDRPFEEGFFAHLRSVYRWMAETGVWEGDPPEFEPILSASKMELQERSGVMARGSEPITVRFECDAKDVRVTKAIYIAGNLPELGDWTPNSIAMRDDGKEGDRKTDDDIWTLTLILLRGQEVQYKYTNSGTRGEWSPSEEFPQSNRSFTVEGTTDSVVVRKDTFGKYE
ncbi:hypothetical protein KKH27_00785 [bacterium]|nr:hypothetical protein [bacterium]MBU1984417.1 hypothetical protein [bacterium]